MSGTRLPPSERREGRQFCLLNLVPEEHIIHSWTLMIVPQGSSYFSSKKFSQLTWITQLGLIWMSTDTPQPCSRQHRQAVSESSLRLSNTCFKRFLFMAVQSCFMMMMHDGSTGPVNRGNLDVEKSGRGKISCQRRVWSVSLFSPIPISRDITYSEGEDTRYDTSCKRAPHPQIVPDNVPRRGGLLLLLLLLIVFSMPSRAAIVVPPCYMMKLIALAVEQWTLHWRQTGQNDDLGSWKWNIADFA